MYLELHQRFLAAEHPEVLFSELVQHAEFISAISPEIVTQVVQDFVRCYEESLFHGRFYSLMLLGILTEEQQQPLIEQTILEELGGRQLALKNLASTLIIHSLHVDPKALPFLGRLQHILTK